MLISHNFKFIDQKEFSIGLDDRAFLYGDGLFETILFQGGKICLFDAHFKRLKKGMEALGFKGAEALKKEVLRHQIESLVKKNNIDSKTRIKVFVWRKKGGIYTPDNLFFNILITAKKVAELKEAFPSIRTGFSNTINIEYSKISAFKTSNALPYILAGIEAKDRKLDDLILLNNKEKIVECIYSNVFWVKEGEVFTPCLKTGCVAGVMRKYLIKLLTKNGITVNEVKADRQELLKAKHVFTTNVFGIRHIYRVNRKRFSKFSLIEKLLTETISGK